jgi:hypothetical protein
MPQFKFRVRDGVVHPNPQGLDLPGVADARLAALQMTQTLLREHAGEPWINDDWQLVVTTADGRAVFVLQISSISAGAQPGVLPRC